MSRTYRTHLEWVTRFNGRNWTWEEEKAFLDSLGIKNRWLCRMGWNGHYILDRMARDRKPWNKPPRWFKVMNRRNERSKENAAVRLEKEVPLFRKGDAYKWS